MTVRSLFEQDNVKSKFQQMLGKKAAGFMTSVLQIVSASKNLKDADPMTVYYSAAIAATMDLPINPNLGFAWIIPYNNKGKKQAQFQMGYKGYVQLAQRTGQYAKMNVIPVHENQFRSFNALTEDLDADFTVDGEGPVVGYCAYFKGVTGFEKTVYWSRAKVDKHAQKYSKSYGDQFGQWKTNFDSMALKTVLKHALSKWGILSIEMQTAIQVDQAVINDDEGMDLEFVDSTEEPQDDQSKTENRVDKVVKNTEKKLNIAANPAEGIASSLAE